MKISRFWLAITFVWFFFLYNVERLGEPINIASLAYVYVLVTGVLVILIPLLHTLPFYLTTILAMLPYVFLKYILGFQIFGQNLPLTITEACFIGITIFLTDKLGKSIGKLNQIVAELTISSQLEGSQSFELGQGQIYREIRRARHYHRPVALLAISVSEESLEVSLDRFIKESQQKLAREYVSARLANFLVEEMQDTDVVTRRNDHFVLLLPEAGRDNVADIVRRIQKEAKEKLDLNIKIGTSTFPDEAVTFERMLEQAEAKMQAHNSIDEAQPEPVMATTEGSF